MENLSQIKLVLNRIYVYLFVERFNKKIKFDFPKDIYRWDLVKFLIKKYNFKSYLEIGCDKDQLFSKIDIDIKIGVDPISGGNIRDSSDNFFKKSNQKFDIIFIDGLHHYDQVSKDIKNSLSVLNEKGIILVHDCLPQTKAHQSVPRYRGTWNGDVWKSIVEFRTKENLDIFVCMIDFGIGVIKKRKNQDLLKLNKTNFKKLKFKDYYYNHKKFMNIKSYDETLRII